MAPSHQSSSRSRYSSSNSRYSKRTRARANSKRAESQSSTDSQKARASARSKLIEEAKEEAETLKALRQEFDEIVNEFPEDVRDRNKDIVKKWRLLFPTVEKCTKWGPVWTSYLNLRLQNPPGQDIMDGFNEQFEKFATLVWQLLNDLPAPSDFAKPDVWSKVQEATPILCLRPPNARGLPLATLHEVFRRFQVDTSRPIPTTKETVAVQIAASKLCSRMGEAFENEKKRGEVFDECISGILEKGEAERQVRSHPAGHYGKIDRCIKEANIMITLREDKLELGLGGSDAYMQIARCYHLVVDSLTNDSAEDPNASNFLSHGAPCFLVCLIGPMLFVCGGFYDGHKPVVEPLARPVIMLTDHRWTRQAEVATVLGALVKGISSLRLLVNEASKISFAPSTPRVYGSCILLEPEGEVGTLTFVSRPNDGYQRLFLGTLSSIPGLQVLVKLVPRFYSQDVHKYMAKEGLAPKLYGYAKLEGAPTAYVMEYLDPSNWKTLNEIFKHDEKKTRKSMVDRTQLQKAVDNIIETLKSKNYVHGDLRSNNIMIRTDVKKKSVNLRVVDFDWAGEAGKVCYPAERNTDIKWPGEAGEPIEKHHDSQMVESWLT